jgi:glycosyltransferase involved in cell wall biosynthesis
VPTAVEQIDPARGEQEIVLKEIEKWPGWQALPGQIPDEYYARLEAEWNTATKVLVNSEWSKAALSACGVPEEKLTVMPLAYEISKNATKIEQPRKGRPTFLWLGQVILRKGIQYLIEAARLVPGVRIIVAGPIGISAQAQATAPPNVEFVGPVPRLNATDYYLAADAFVLPTMSDGFALTQLEAMAHGLPVIVTPNCARIVTDDYDGKVIPAGDSNALAAALESLAANPAGMRQMSHNALETVRHYSMAALTARLGSFFDSLAPLTNGV